MSWLTEVQWSPYAAGIGIGVLSWLTFLISRKSIGCSTAFARTSGMLERLVGGEKVVQKPYYQKVKPEIEWGWMLVAGIAVGSFISALASGDLVWQWVPSLWADAFGESVALRLGVALLGGAILGFGARWAGGCTSGHGISGTLQLAVSSWITTICFFLSGILTALLIFRVIGLG